MNIVLTTVISLILLAKPCLAQDQVSGVISRLGDTTHVEFQGQKTWDYRAKREGNVISLNIPDLDQSTKNRLLGWNDKTIKKVEIGQGVDGGLEIKFHVTNSNIDYFDYLTDQPSRLIVDFFKLDEKSKPQQAKVKDSKKQTTKKKLATKLPQKKSSRLPASVKVVATDEKESKVDLNDIDTLDGADPEYKRFSIQDSDINEESIIAHANKLYLNFPMLELPPVNMNAWLDKQPIYDIRPKDNNENKKARLLLTLFNNKRFAVFQKALEFFKKEFPDSKYNEIVDYMTADIKMSEYEESKNKAHLDTAIRYYQKVLEKYPDSELAERTSLLIAKSYYDQNDHIAAIKAFKRFSDSFPKSKFFYEVKISLSDSYRKLKNFDEAKEILNEIEKDPEAGKFATLAAFKKGDLIYYSKKYDDAINYYKKMIEEHKNVSKDYPNAYFNTAEANFIKKNYKASLDGHREFLIKFPEHEYGGFSMARIGELLQILGADQKKVDAAWLETNFRYLNSEGAGVANIRLFSQRMDRMKDKEVSVVIEEMKNIEKKSKLPDMESFVTLMIVDGYHKRKEYEKALTLLMDFYRNHPEADLERFRNAIVYNITNQLAQKVSEKKFIDFFKIYGEYASVWLKNPDRIDMDYYFGQSFEQAGVYGEASKFYQKTLNRIYSIRGTQEEKERRVLEDLPTTETLNLRLSAMSVAQKDYSKASLYLDAIKDDKNLAPHELVEKTELLAKVAQEKGQIELAKKYIQQLIASWKGKPALVSKPYLTLAKLENQTGHTSSALKNLEKINNMQKDSEKVPSDILNESLNLKADIHLKRKESDEAIKTLRSLMSKDSSGVSAASVRYKLGKVYFDTNNFIEAEKAWSALPSGSMWSKLAQEQLSHSKWKDQYKKYINRIPAMAGQRNN